jgi:hypothetical protein
LSEAFQIISQNDVPAPLNHSNDGEQEENSENEAMELDEVVEQPQVSQVLSQQKPASARRQDLVLS